MHKKAKESFDVLKELINSKRCLTIREIKDILNLELSERRVKDILDGLVEYFSEEVISVSFINKKTCYKINNTSNIIFELLLKSDDISFLLQDLNNINPNILKTLEDETKKDIKKLILSEKDIFIFQNSIMEDLKDKQIIFSKLKNAVKNRKYIKIKKDNNFIEVKALKLLFLDNNWYLATENEENQFRFFRIAFIEDVKEVWVKNKNGLKEKTYQKSVLLKYKDYFKNIQNSLTLYGVEPKKAKILAKKEIAHYFKKGMKKFLPSQKFIEENENGIIFEINYTQSLEILPFIKKWIPNLIILSPNELKEELKKDFEKIINL